MVANLPTGSFTIKVPEVVAYLFAAAFFARAIVRKERVVLPPATAQLFWYLSALMLATVLAPPIPDPFLGGILPTDRNSPGFRPLSIIIWLGLSWMVVVAFYNFVGTRPRLLWRCARAHIISGGVASIISLAIYVLALKGIRVVNVASGDIGRNLVTDAAGEGLRLAGVAYEPLFLAFYLQTVIPITLVALLVYPEWLPRWLSGLCLFVMVMALLLTISAGGISGVLLAMVLLLPTRLIRRVPRSSKIKLSVAMVALAAVALYVALSQRSYTNIALYAATKVTGGGDTYRKAEWTAGYRMFLERPWTGMGPGLASYHFPKYHPWMQSQAIKGLPDVMNLYMNELAIGGVIGFLALGCLVFKAASVPLRQLLRWRPHRVPVLSALSASLAGCMVQYMSLNQLFIVYLCAAVGLMFAAARAAEMGALEPVGPMSV
jgi:O-antigen ligase